MVFPSDPTSELCTDSVCCVRPLETILSLGRIGEDSPQSVSQTRDDAALAYEHK